MATMASRKRSPIRGAVTKFKGNLKHTKDDGASPAPSEP
jgi:hypothetical protein